jgi:hypothetical protein
MTDIRVGDCSCRGTIEDCFPEVPDGTIQFTDGAVDPVSRWVLTNQPHRRLEVQSRGEQPVNHDVAEAAATGIRTLPARPPAAPTA